MVLMIKQDSANIGEISPKLHDRTSIGVYARAMSEMLNFEPQPQGGFIKRGGTRRVAIALEASGKSRLIPFYPDATEWFTIELSDSEYRVRDYTGSVQQLNGTNTRLAHPFTDISRIQYAQSNDVIFLVGGGAHHTITRKNATTFELEPLEFADGPFQSENTDRSVTLQLGTSSGGVTTTLAGTGITFSNDVVGSYIKLYEQDLSGIPRWDPAHDYVVGEQLRSADNVYTTEVAGKGGGTVEAVIPSHESGVVSQGPGLASFRYLHSGSCIFEVTARNSATELAGVIVSSKPYEGGDIGSGPADVVASGTSRFAFSEFYDGHYPDAISFFQSRLCYAKGSKVFMSRTGNFKSHRGGPNPDDAISVELTSDSYGEIYGLSELNGSLMANTSGGVSRIVASDGGSVNPGNVTQRRVKKRRMSSIQPINTDDSLFVLGDPATTVYEMAYSNEAGGFLSPSASILSDHILPQGGGVVDVAISKSGNQKAIFVLSDGTIASLVFDKYQEVVGWSREEYSGKIVSVCVTPGNISDETWFVVERTVSGAALRTVERLVRTRDFDAYDKTTFSPYITTRGVPANLDVELPCFVDAARFSSGTGLDHLEGMEVHWATSDAHGSAVVAGGAITGVPRDCWIGLPVAAQAKTLRLDIGRRGDGSDAKRDA